ncbi:MAG TPA: ethanolamine ammonia-lyase reactivating factor EutA [Streptosporangiaceae bacterium]|jgi:ethanolamine utilization protein EutA
MTATARPGPLAAATAGEFQYALDNIDLTSIGVDVGSTTSHLMFSHVHLKRETERHSTRYVVTSQEVLWRSPIRLTPYRPGGSIDAGQLGRWVEQDFTAAGLDRADLDSGAVILTGEALKQHNAKALAEAIAAQAGDFVCVSAGHHLEAMLAAYGSGSVGLSARTGQRVLCVDIGGGTTKLSLIDHGTVRRTAAIEVGARMVSFGPSGTVGQVASAVPAVLATLGPAATGPPVPGEPLDTAGRQALVSAAAGQILAVPRRQGGALAAGLLLTGPLHPDFAEFDAVTFAGGVSEYIYGREGRDFGDLGSDIATAVRRVIGGGGLPVPVLDPGHGIRATVVGASQSSVQVSGSTVAVPAGSELPLRNVPVVHPAADLSGDIGEAAVADAIGDALDGAPDLTPPVALAFAFGGPPSYQRLRALAGGIATALRRAWPGGELAVLVMDRDIAASTGALLTEELDVRRPVLCLDNLELRPLDYLDIGRPVWPAGVYPVVIKSLLFGPVSGPGGKAANE